MLAIFRDSLLQLPVLQAGHCSEYELHLRGSWWTCFAPTWMVVLRWERIQPPNAESERDLEETAFYERKGREELCQALTASNLT